MVRVLDVSHVEAWQPRRPRREPLVIVETGGLVEQAARAAQQHRRRLQALERGDVAAAAVELKRVSDLARTAMEELRAVVFELRPASLEAEGLATVLRKHVEVLRRVTGQEIDLKVCEAPRLSPECATQVLRIAQEALQNALRHAGAKRIAVRLRGDDTGLVLEIEDDGLGFDPDAPGLRSRRLGLTSMEERAERLGGWLEIRSAPGQGTTVAGQVPITAG